jgi:hypothetical protein
VDCAAAWLVEARRTLQNAAAAHQQAMRRWTLFIAPFLVFYAAVHANAHVTESDGYPETQMQLEDWMATVLHASAAARRAPCTLQAA